MARTKDDAASAIYETSEEVRDRCLQSDESLFFPGEQLWTRERLGRIKEVLIDNPDESSRDFLTKFHEQLARVGDPQAFKLAAELLYLHLIYPSSVSGARKREIINEVLSWGGFAAPRETGVQFFGLLDAGLGSAGQGYNSRRPFELGFLIEFAIAWKELPDVIRTNALSDPWEFQEVVDRVADGRSFQFRHMLLHLMFPDSFETAVSGAQRAQIRSAFKDFLGSDNDDGLDKQLLQIRREICSVNGGEANYYEEPLQSMWDLSSGQSDDHGVQLDLIEFKRQIVLFGPPGTGKTYRAKKLADQILRRAALRQLGPVAYFRSADSGAWSETNVHHLQLHPGFGYEDFVVGLQIAENGSTHYRTGYLPRLVARINADRKSGKNVLPHVLILDEMNRTDLTRMLGEYFSLLENRGEVIELTAVDDRGESIRVSLPAEFYVIGTMNLIDQSVDQIDFALRRRFLWIDCPFDPDALVSAARIRWEEQAPSVSWNAVEEDFRILAEAGTAMNEIVAGSELLGKQYEIGHAFFLDAVDFLKSEGNLRRKKNYLWRNDGSPADPVTQLWRLSLQPLLREYLSGLDESAGEAELVRLKACLHGRYEFA